MWKRIYDGIMVVAIFILIALAVGEAKADEWWVVSTVGSYHFERSKDYNENNFGLGIERTFDKNFSQVAGYYQNSFDRQTLYVGIKYLPVNVNDVRLGVTLFLATGYHGLTEGALFIPLLTMDYHYGRMGLSILSLPDPKSGMIAAQLKWRW